MATYKEMCETIVEADLLRDKNGNPPTSEQIFNYSSTGELFMVHDWYEEAKLIIAARGSTNQ